jgi:hypothetical protein
MAAAYRIRFFFDWGSGTCLWSANDAARQAFDYPIDPGKLPLSAETIDRIGRMCAWYDKALNWDYPPDPGPWRQDECDRFNGQSALLLESIRRELGADFDVIDESYELREDPDLDEYLKDPKAFRRARAPT